MYLVFIFCLVCEVINFEIDLSYLIKPFFNLTKNSVQKCKYFKYERDFNIKVRTFFIILKGSQLLEIVSDPRVDLLVNFQETHLVNFL